jgi:hypothetical protein
MGTYSDYALIKVRTDKHSHEKKLEKFIIKTTYLKKAHRHNFSNFKSCAETNKCAKPKPISY